MCIVTLYSELPWSMRAVRLDPLSPMIATTSGIIFWTARQYDRAIEMGRRALELVPDFHLARFAIALALVQQGMCELAVADMEEVVQTTNRLPIYLHMLGHCYASAGRRQDAMSILQQLQEISKKRYVPAYWPAVIYTSLHERDEAFRWLEIAYEERSAWMIYTKVFPYLDNLRPDPRFKDLLHRMNYPR